MICGDCGSEFPLVHGIPDLAEKKSYYYCPVPRDWMESALAAAWSDLPESGPKRVETLLRDVIDRMQVGRRKREWIENLVDEGRALGDLLVAGDPQGHVLNLGCGWDQTTIHLARTWKRVTAMDLTRFRVELLALKLFREGLDNVTLLIGGDSARLPFPDDSFDAVSLNGVLEWVAGDWDEPDAAAERLPNRAAKLIHHLREVHGRRNPRRVQLEFLREVVRVLRPEGQLFVGIENRYARKYFRGEPDNHSRLKFASLLPRTASHIYSLARCHHPYLTYTYSLRGYRKLLAEAGLPAAEFHALEPSYRKPSSTVPLADADACRGFVRSRPGAIRLMPTSLFRRTATCFGIAAGRAGGRPSRLRAVLDRVARDLDLPPDIWRGMRIDTSAKAKVSVSTAEGRDPVIVKIPLSPAAAAGLERNRLTLNRLDQTLPQDAPLRPLLPRPLLAGDHDGTAFTVETRLPGKPWSDADRGAPEAGTCDRILRLTRMIFSALPETAVAAFPASVGGIDADTLGELAARSDPGLADAPALVADFLAANPLGGPGLCKGDFTLSNILLRPGREICGLIDWDDSVLTGFPLQGLADFLFSWLWRRGFSRADSLEILLSAEPVPGLPDSDLERALEEAGAGRRELALAALSSWIDHLCQEMRHQPEFFDPGRVERLLVEPCRTVAPLLSRL